LKIVPALHRAIKTPNWLISKESSALGRIRAVPGQEKQEDREKKTVKDSNKSLMKKILLK
jgi:hypothetical protein